MIGIRVTFVHSDIPSMYIVSDHATWKDSLTLITKTYGRIEKIEFPTDDEFFNDNEAIGVIVP